MKMQIMPLRANSSMRGMNEVAGFLILNSDKLLQELLMMMMMMMCGCRTVTAMKHSR